MAVAIRFIKFTIEAHAVVRTFNDENHADT